MSAILMLYFGFAAYFVAVDLLAGWVAGSPFRPWCSVALNLAWPLFVPVSVIGAAMIIRDHREDQREKERRDGGC